MSSFIVSNTHASFIVSGLVKTGFIVQEEAQGFLNLMATLNNRILDTDRAEPHDYASFTFLEQDTGLTAENTDNYDAMVVMAKLVDCFNYQCDIDEHYRKSLVFITLNHFKGAIVANIKEILLLDRGVSREQVARYGSVDRFPGYAEAAWDLDDK